MFESDLKVEYSLNDYPVEYMQVGEGFTAIDNTVKRMIQAINESAKNIRIRSAASNIIKDIPEKDKYGEVDAIYQWLQNHTHYVKDIDGEEMLQSPLVALDMIDKGFAFQGDCDCLTTLLLSLLKSIGFACAIRIAGYKNDGKYTHVYGLVYMSDFGEWLPIDPIKRGVMVGWEESSLLRNKDYQI